MANSLADRLRAAPVVPLVQAADAAVANLSEVNHPKRRIDVLQDDANNCILECARHGAQKNTALEGGVHNVENYMILRS